MRVLMVTPHYAPAWRYGGLAEAVPQLSRHLVRAGACVRVLSADSDPSCDMHASARSARADGVEDRYFKRRALDSAAPGMVAALARELRDADIVHLHAVYSFPTIPTLVAARLFGRPLVWTLHGALQEWPRRRRPAFKSMWNAACRVLAPPRLLIHLTSAFEAEESRARIPRTAPTVIVPHGVEIPGRVAAQHRGDRLRLVFVGRVHPSRGLENLLDACALLSRDGAIKYSLKIAGWGAAGYADALRRRICELGIADAVAMLGEVEGDRRRLLFESSDALVLPSHSECFGMVVAEALARGLPVIASRSTPWNELEAAGCGLWVANDPASLAGAIRRLARMPLVKMGEAGRRWVATNYSWERAAVAMLDCYRRLLAPPRGASELNSGQLSTAAEPARERRSASGGGR